MNNVIIDLETLGVRAGCVVLSVGLARFDLGGVHETYYAEINRQTCLNTGLTIDYETLNWWERQADNAILSRTAGAAGLALADVLTEVAAFCHTMTARYKEDVAVWGNGADFDLPILQAAYVACGFRAAPWRPHQGRCYRTLKNLFPGVQAVKTRTDHHNALADATWQAHHAIELLRAAGVGEVGRG